MKIQFLLKKPDEKQESLEYITIAEPKIDKTREFGWNNYVCEVYFSDIKYNHPIYGTNPIEPLCLASEIVKNHFQGLVAAGYVIREAETKEPWLLEKLSDNFLQEKVDQIKNNPNLSQGDKEKILGIIDSFGKTVVGDQLKEAIDKKLWES